MKSFVFALLRGVLCTAFADAIGAPWWTGLILLAILFVNEQALATRR